MEIVPGRISRLSKLKNLVEKYDVETGFFKNGLPYAKMGHGERVLFDLEVLSFDHAPPSGFMLKMFIKSHTPLAGDWTVYQVGRRPNLPADHLMDEMAVDYAEAIREEFHGPVDVMGVSTGGQIAHFLAANHPEVVRKLVIISAAYRLSPQGVEVEGRAGNLWGQGKRAQAIAALMDLASPPGIKQRVMKWLIRLTGGLLFRNIEYPGDFLVEVRADREMDFKDRLPDIRAPTLILSGAEDLAYAVEDVRETAAGIPNAELKIYEGYGHELSQTNAKELLKDVLEFLQR